MTNLISLQDQLKGLRDEDIDREIENPSGTVPVFLVASEKQRRAEMRRAYEGEQARRAEGDTTVLEDLMSARGMGSPALPPPGVTPIGSASSNPMAAPGGIDAAVPGYANGGLIDYGSISTGYGGLSDQLARNREQNKWLAIAQLGAGIAGGTSPSFATNVGQGSASGLEAYQQGVVSDTQNQLQLLNAQLGLLQAQDRSALAQEQFTFEQEQAARDALMDDRRLELAERRLNEPTAAMKNWDYRQTLSPEEQAEFDRTASRGQRSMTDFNAASTAYRRSIEFAEDKVASEPKFAAIKFGGEVDPKLKTEYDARIRDEANRRFLDFYPQYQQYLGQFGRGSQMAPAGAPSGVKFIEGLPDGATVKTLTSPIMRGATDPEGQGGSW